MKKNLITIESKQSKQPDHHDELSNLLNDLLQLDVEACRLMSEIQVLIAEDKANLLKDESNRRVQFLKELLFQ